MAFKDDVGRSEKVYGVVVAVSYTDRARSARAFQFFAHL